MPLYYAIRGGAIVEGNTHEYVETGRDMASRSSRPRGRLLCALAGDFPREGNNAAISLARMLSGPEAEPDRRRAGGMIIQWRRRRSPGRETCGPRPGPFSGTASSGAAGGARSRPRAARPGPRRRTRRRRRGRAPRTTSSNSSGAGTTPMVPKSISCAGLDPPRFFFLDPCCGLDPCRGDV